MISRNINSHETCQNFWDRLLADDEESNIYGTDPSNSDTDGDGITDGDEVIYWNNNPDASWNKDLDGDGIINLLDFDSDNDGLSDGYENNHGSNPANSTSAPSGVIAGTVRDNNSNIITGITISITVYTGDPCDNYQYIKVASTNSSNGTYLFEGLDPEDGPYYLKTDNNGSNYLNMWWSTGGGTNVCSVAGAIDLSVSGQSGKDFHLDKGGIISGIVTADSDGQPIAGLMVQASSTGAYSSTQTQSDGSYAITGLTTGSYRVYVQTSGTDYVREYYDNTYDYNTATFVGVTLGQTTSGIDFGLAIAGKITGVVTSDSDGEPIAGLRVSAGDFSIGGSGYAQTQSDGSYTITGLPTGSYKVQVMFYSTTDYSPEYYDNIYNEDSATFVGVTLGQTTSGIDFGLAIAGKITGLVTSDSDGEPIAGLTVQSCDYDHCGRIYSAQTQSDGSYTITGLPIGSYRVYVQTSGTDYVREYYDNIYDDESTTPVTSVDVTTGQTTSGINFGLVIGGKITGVVTGDSGGEPIAGLSVSVNDYSTNNWWCGSTTQSDGSYTISGLPSGSYRVEVDTSGTDYAEEYYDNTYDEDSATPVVVTLGQTTSGINFGLVIGGKITGVVTRESDGEPIAGLTVRANDYSTGDLVASSYYESQSDGSYTIKGLPPGSYRVEVDTYGTDYAPEYYDNTYDYNSAVPVDVAVGQTISGINFGLVIGGKITGIVTRDSDGEPIANLYMFADDYVNARTQSDGSYIITRLPPGSYRVYVHTSGTDYAKSYYDNTYNKDSAKLVGVTLGQTTSGIDFSLVIGGKITGIVTRDSDGEPITNLYVIANNYSNENWYDYYTCFSETQSDGLYIITGLPPGDYRVCVSTYRTDYAWESYDNTYDFSTSTPVPVTLGQTTSGIDFGLAIGGNISGTVYQSDGITKLTGIQVAVCVFHGDPCGSNELITSVKTVNGTYTLKGLPLGTIYLKTDNMNQLDYTNEWWASNASTYDCNSAESITVSSGQSISGIDFQLNTNIVVDSDSDGLPDDIEAILSTDPNDADTDNDGIPDGVEDDNHNGVVDLGETDPRLIDTDNDGIQDGTELGITTPVADPDGDGPILGTNTYIFISDKNPTTTTDPLNPDTDGDSLLDGQEDTNHNGRFDPGELDPNNITGDVDGYNDIDLADAILALQVMTGVELSSTVHKEADVNGDGKIGLEEVIYILQKVSGLRQ